MRSGGGQPFWCPQRYTARFMRRWIQRSIALLVGIVLAMLVGEVAIRGLGLAPQLGSIEIDTAHGTFVSSDNDVLKYLPKPGAGDVNSAGFRDREYAVDKPTGTYRIVVLGDSIAFGYCDEERSIPLEQTFSEVLETRLATTPLAGHASVEVLNFGVSGYDTTQEVELLAEKALAYSPDLVLVAYCLNDITSSSRELFLFRQQDDWGTRQAANKLYRGAVFRSHLVRLIWAMTSAPEPVSLDAGAGAGTPDNRASAKAFNRLNAISELNGFDVMLVVFPYFDRFESYPHGAHHHALRTAAERFGWGYLDLLPVFQGLSRDTDELCTPCCNVHPNVRGHELTAAAIEANLRENP